MPSTFHSPGPRHVGIIMDGNGRWAVRRGEARVAGHLAGIAAVRRTVRAAPRLGIAALTLFAFSSDNWRRPKPEVAALMQLLERYLQQEAAPLQRAGVRCTVIGRRDRLPPTLTEAIAAMETVTTGGEELWLRLAIDYSARYEIAAAAGPGGVAPAWTRARIATALEDKAAGPVDLLIRTGGEQRLSDFLLWEAAYAELVFTATPWPAFGALHLRRAVAAFQRRDRRFGGLPRAVAAAGMEAQ